MPVQSSGDAGLGTRSDPVTEASQKIGNVTSMHTWLIVAGAVILLWLLGGFVFRTVRI